MKTLRSALFVFAGMVAGCVTAAVVPLRADERPAVPNAMEYLFVEGVFAGTSKRDVAELNRLAREGWRLSATSSVSGHTNGYILERPMR